MSEYSRRIFIETARITEEIERTRQICARTLESLREPFPSTFLGNKIDQPDEKADNARSVPDRFLGRKTQEPFPARTGRPGAVVARHDRNGSPASGLGSNGR